MCRRLTAAKSLKARCSRLKSCTIAHAADVLLHVAVDPGDGGANAAVALAHMVAEDAGDVQDRRQDGECQQRQPPVHAQHDDDDEGEGEDVLEDREDAGGEHLVEGIDVGGDTRDQPADRVMVEEAGRHALDVAEDLAAQIEHDLLAGPLHQVGLDKLQDIGNEQRAEIEQAKLGDAGHWPRAEMVGQPGELLRRRVRHVGIDGNLDQIRPDNIGAGLEDDGYGRNGSLEFVWPQIGQQTAHEAAVVGFAHDLVIVRCLLRRFFLRLSLFLSLGHLSISILDA